MENFREKLNEAFASTPTARIQGRGRKPLQINKGNKLLGLKPNRKFLGRNRSGRNKIKSKRRNNFKTFEARKILAQRHGVTNALKKVDNKYLLTYGDIARLMRNNNYTYDATLRRWLTKKEKEKDTETDSNKKDTETDSNKKENPYPNRPKSPSEEPNKRNSEENYPNDSEDDNLDTNDPLNRPDPFKFQAPKKKKPKDKDLLKTLQARIILISNGESDFGNYEIIPEDIQFSIPDEQVKKRMLDKEYLWLKNKDKWVDYKGKDPNPLEKYKGTLGRAILVHNGEYSFLNFENGNIDSVEEKMKELGYEYTNGSWLDTQENGTLEEAAGTSSTPSNAGTGTNSQGISPFMSRLGSKIAKRINSEHVVI